MREVVGLFCTWFRPGARGLNCDWWSAVNIDTPIPSSILAAASGLPSKDRFQYHPVAHRRRRRAEGIDDPSTYRPAGCHLRPARHQEQAGLLRNRVNSWCMVPMADRILCLYIQLIHFRRCRALCECAQNRRTLMVSSVAGPPLHSCARNGPRFMRTSTAASGKPPASAGSHRPPATRYVASHWRHGWREGRQGCGSCS